MKECSCKPGGFESEIVHIPDGMILHREIRNISVDACIAPVIRLLLEDRIETLGCCCGHRKAHPSVVIAGKYSLWDCNEILDLISTIDDRKWDVEQWKLVKFEPKGYRYEAVAQS